MADTVFVVKFDSIEESFTFVNVWKTSEGAQKFCDEKNKDLMWGATYYFTEEEVKEIEPEPGALTKWMDDELERLEKKLGKEDV